MGLFVRLAQKATSAAQKAVSTAKKATERVKQAFTGKPSAEKTAQKTVPRSEPAVQQRTTTPKTSPIKKITESRNERLTQRQIEHFRVSNAQTVGKGSSADLFYGLNRDITKNVPVPQRNQKIMEYYKVNNLKDAYDATMKRYSETIEKAERLSKDTEDWPEEYSETEFKYDYIMAETANR